MGMTHVVILFLACLRVQPHSAATPKDWESCAYNIAPCPNITATHSGPEILRISSAKPSENSLGAIEKPFIQAQHDSRGYLQQVGFYNPNHEP